MKKTLLTLMSVYVCLCMQAQDFTSRFIAHYPADSALVCVTISPKMMEEILRSETEKDDAMIEIISNLKSMQLLSSESDGAFYYAHALEVLEQNGDLFEPLALITEPTEDSRILIRKREDTIIELVMLTHTDERFSVINFTGNMDPDFIARIAGAMQAP